MSCANIERIRNLLNIKIENDFAALSYLEVYSLCHVLKKDKLRALKHLFRPSF